MNRKRTVLYGIACLAGLWVLVLTAMAMARSRQVTAEKVIAYVDANPLTQNDTPETRQKTIAGLADRMNRLEYEDRRKLQANRSLEAVFVAMTDAERLAFLELTLPRGMTQMMEAFNDMPRERRQRMVRDAMAELERASTPGSGPGIGSRADRRPGLDDAAVQRIIEQGLKSYFGDASAEAKLDLQPLIEQLQHLLQNPPHGRR